MHVQINLNWLTYKLRFLHTALPVTKLKWNRLQVVHPANDNTLRQHPSSSVLFWTSREIFLFNLIVAGEQVGLTFRFTNRLRPNIGQTEQSEVNEFQMRYKKAKGWARTGLFEWRIDLERLWMERRVSAPLVCHVRTRGVTCRKEQTNVPER